jgi:hypothetical protein
MYFAVAAIAMQGVSQQVDKITLQVYQETFVARKGSVAFRTPLKAIAALPVTNVAFRRNETFAVWDERGLSLRHDKKLFTTKLPGLPVSPKLFSRDEILSNLRDFKSGHRTREADALSGAKRLGKDVYFLVRWDDSVGRPWLEALMRVDLTSNSPRPELVGKFEGISLGSKSIDDRLMILGTKLAILGRSGKNWNLDTYDPETGQFESDKLGDTLVAFALDSPGTGVFVEQTPYGTSRSGTVDLAEGSRRGVTESPGFTRFLDSKHPLLFIERRPTGSVLANGDTGALLSLDEDSGVARLGPYTVVWSPKVNPVKADLYDPERWEPVATWMKR